MVTGLRAHQHSYCPRAKGGIVPAHSPHASLRHTRSRGAAGTFSSQSFLEALHAPFEPVGDEAGPEGLQRPIGGQREGKEARSGCKSLTGPIQARQQYVSGDEPAQAAGFRQGQRREATSTRGGCDPEQPDAAQQTQESAESPSTKRSSGVELPAVEGGFNQVQEETVNTSPSSDLATPDCATSTSVLDGAPHAPLGKQHTFAEFAEFAQEDEERELQLAEEAEAALKAKQERAGELESGSESSEDEAEVKRKARRMRKWVLHKQSSHNEAQDAAQSFNTHHEIHRWVRQPPDHLQTMHAGRR